MDDYRIKIHRLGERWWRVQLFHGDEEVWKGFSTSHALVLEWGLDWLRRVNGVAA